MCGISGAVRLTTDSAPLDRDEMIRTRDAMASRGPDGTGLWSSQDGLAVLAHRRLAIIDLSEAAAQPMSSADGRWTLVFNGEIYNYRQLRKELAGEGVSFRTASDSEVLLELVSRHGAAA